MNKFFAFIILTACLISGAGAETRAARATQTTPYNYNYMYPYMNNKMRTNLNPGVAPNQSSNMIDTVVRTSQTPNTTQRRVVPRRAAATSARSATPMARAGGTSTAARAAATPNTTQRRVVQRRGITPQQAAAVRTSRVDNTYVAPTVYDADITDTYVSQARCLADYTDCMNNYCQRENTAYNRCYCSAKLSQIDSLYQPKIDDLTTKIIKLKYKGTWTDAEMNEYWASTIGKYTNDNSWINIDNALNINWADTDSRVRGQQAFATGHQYCVQHLRACNYMATNLRDVYRSEIARDCAKYESDLQRIVTTAESIVGSMQ